MIGLAIATFAGGHRAADVRPDRGRARAGDGRFGIRGGDRDAARRRISPTRGCRRRRSRGSRGCAKEVRYTYMSVGGQGDEAVDEGSVFVKLTPKAERSRSQAEIVAEIRRGLVAAGRRLDVDQHRVQRRGEADPAAAAGAGCRSSSRRLADAVVAEVTQVPGAVDVGLSTKGQKPELDVQLDRGLAGSARRDRRSGGAGASAGVCRHRRRRLDRSVR